MQEHWSGQLFPSPGDLLDSGIEPGSPALQADSFPPEPYRSHWEAPTTLGGVPKFRRAFQSPGEEEKELPLVT